MATQGGDTGGAVYLRVGLDASGVADGVSEIKQELNTLPAAAAQAAQGTNKSLATLGVPADATANIERFKDAFGGIARATREELGESARFTNSYVSQIKRTASDVDAVTQAMVNKARTLQSADPRLQNETVNQAIAGLQKLASQNEVVTAAVKQQAAAQQVANKATQEAAAQFANFERSAQSARLELLSFGKTASEKYQIRAELLGIDKSQATQQIVADLRAAEAAAIAAGKGVGQSITPALQGAALQGRALNAALRQVPAQFTDIVVSLQGGQAPLTVLLQQGGQLKDIFGGVGEATRALSGYVVGLVNPFTVVAAAAAAVGFGFFAGRKESEEFNKALILTGNQTGVTASSLALMATNISAVSGTTGAAAEALTAFAAAGAVGAAGIQKATEAALALEKFGGQAVAETVKQFKSLGDDPLKASIKLNESTNFLTASVYQQIKALEEQGRTIEAAKVAQDAFTESSLSKAGELEKNLGTLERGWLAVKSAISGAGDALKNIGRLDPIVAQVAAQQAEVDRRQRPGATVQRGLNLTSPVRPSDIAEAQSQLDLLNRRVLKEQELSTSKAAQKLETESLIAADKILEGLASKKVKMDRELVETRTVLARAGKDEIAIQEALAAVRKKYAEKALPKPPKESNPFAEEQGKSYAKYIEDFNKAAVEAQIKTDGLTKSQGNLVKMLLDPVFQAMPDTWREVGLQAAYAAIAVEQNVSATEAAAKAQADYMEKLGSAGAKEVASLEQRVAKQAQHNAEIGKTAEQIEAIRRVAETAATDELESQEKAIAALLDKEEALVDYAGTQYKVSEEAKAIYEIELKSLREQIKLRKQLAKGYSEGEQKEAAATAAKEAAAEWKRGWEETDRVARDVFVTWATDGSNAAKKIGDTLKKALLSAVYEATLKPLVMQIYTSVVGGAPGAGGAGGIATIGGKVLDFFTGGSSGPSASGGNVDKSILFGTGYGTTGAEAAGGGLFGSMGGAGALLKQVAPWIGGALLLKNLTDYKVESRGSGLTATIGGASGLPSGSVGKFNEFQQTGGLGGGGTTINRDWSVADQGVASYIAKNVQAITDSNRAYGDALGLTSVGIEKFTKSIEISTTGLDAAGQQAAINAKLAEFSAEQITAAYGDALKGVAKEGETTAQTLTRLGTDLTGVNAAFGTLGYTLYDVSVAGASAASTLANAFGGLAQAQSQMGSFYQNFYSQAEQEANTYKTVQADLQKSGITYTVEQLRAATRGDIRSAVDGLAGGTDTAEGAARYAAAVKAANALSGVKSVTTQAPAKDPAPANQAGSSGGGGGSAIDSAASSVVNAWQDAADAIIATMTDIRLSSLETGADSFTKLKAQFAVEIAQASAGDLAAMQDLPELAKALENANKENAKTAVEQALFTSYILESLGRVSGAGAPGPALTAPNYTGVAAVSATAPVPIPVYIPPSTGNTPAGPEAVFERMEQRLAAIEVSNEKVRKLIFDVTEGGRAMQTEAYT